jgi:hypothetical protein
MILHDMYGSVLYVYWYVDCEVILKIVRSDTGILGSNPTQGLDVCVRLFCVCVVQSLGKVLATG